MTPAGALIARLGGRWHGFYGTTRCPAHDDRAPSLTIRDGDRGVLLKCHAGCDPGAIIAALTRQRLWPVAAAPRSNGARPRGASPDVVRAIWRSCRPITATPAERYLRNRGIGASCRRAFAITSA
jgi:putative DNA primase/helicase